MNFILLLYLALIDQQTLYVIVTLILMQFNYAAVIHSEKFV